MTRDSTPPEIPTYALAHTHPIVTQGFKARINNAFQELGANRITFEQARVMIYKYNRHHARTSWVKTDEMQQELSDLVDYFTGESRTYCMTLAYFWRNRAFLASAMHAVDRDFLDSMEIIPESYVNDSVVRDDLEDTRALMAEGLGLLYGMMTGLTFERRKATKNQDDRYIADILKNTVLTSRDFNDWLEYNFLRTYKMPLGMLETSKTMRDRIDQEVASTPFVQHTVHRMTTSDTRKRLLNLFPGITLDGEPRDQADWDHIRTHFGKYVSEPFGPGTRVIPARAAPARPDFFAALRPQF